MDFDTRNSPAQSAAPSQSPSPNFDSTLASGPAIDRETFQRMGGQIETAPQQALCSALFPNKPELLFELFREGIELNSVGKGTESTIGERVLIGQLANAVALPDPADPKVREGVIIQPCQTQLESLKSNGVMELVQWNGKLVPIEEVDFCRHGSIRDCPTGLIVSPETYKVFHKLVSQWRKEASEFADSKAFLQVDDPVLQKFVSEADLAKRNIFLNSNGELSFQVELAKHLPDGVDVKPSFVTQLAVGQMLKTGPALAEDLKQQGTDWLCVQLSETQREMVKGLLQAKIDQYQEESEKARNRLDRKLLRGIGNIARGIKNRVLDAYDALGL